MKKRLLPCAVLVLLLALALPARALREPDAYTAITGTTSIPVIDVSVPTLGNAMINPFQLAVSVGADIEDSQVLSTPLYIENHSEVPVRVSVQINGAIRSGSDMGLYSYSTQGLGITAKKAFIYFEIHATDNPSSVNWDSEYDASKHIVVKNGSTKIQKNILILGSADQEKHYGAFRLAGDCVEEPKIPWTENDGAEIEIVFTFSPLRVGTEIP